MSNKPPIKDSSTSCTSNILSQGLTSPNKKSTMQKAVASPESTPRNAEDELHPRGDATVAIVPRPLSGDAVQTVHVLSAMHVAYIMLSLHAKTMAPPSLQTLPARIYDQRRMCRELYHDDGDGTQESKFGMHLVLLDTHGMPRSLCCLCLLFSDVRNLACLIHTGCMAWSLLGVF